MAFYYSESNQIYLISKRLEKNQGNDFQELDI